MGMSGALDGVSLHCQGTVILFALEEARHLFKGGDRRITWISTGNSGRDVCPQVR